MSRDLKYDYGTAVSPRVCFLCIGHHYQLLHSIPIAAALAASGAVEVTVAGSTERHLTLSQRYLAALGGPPVTLMRLWPRSLQPGAGMSVPGKALVLAASLNLLSGFDAIVTPERTSLLLKKFGLTGPVFVHTAHGAGDRAVGYERRISQFDFTLLAGDKQWKRMSAERLIREGRYSVVGYPKFDLVDALPHRPSPLFAEPRPVVMYNPHFRQKLSSWPLVGYEVLDQFAASRAYNLIFAPHARLFDGASRRHLARMNRYKVFPNIHIDLDGERSWDMSYTRAADVYIGDVSSQVYEFIRRPRPCVFLNPQRVEWHGNPNYLHWNFGPVLNSAEGLCGQVEAARRHHAGYAPAQVAGFAETFTLYGHERSSDRAAAAILNFLATRLERKSAASSQWRDRVSQRGS